MRISYSVPEHLKFGMTVDTWTELVKMTGESIEWLDEKRNEGVYDVWLLVSYAATSCALVQVGYFCVVETVFLFCFFFHLDKY